MFNKDVKSLTIELYKTHRQHFLQENVSVFLDGKERVVRYHVLKELMVTIARSTANVKMVDNADLTMVPVNACLDGLAQDVLKVSI